MTWDSGVPRCCTLKLEGIRGFRDVLNKIPGDSGDPKVPKRFTMK